MADARRALTLVIGYGNTLRRDDALGCMIADEVGRWQRPGLRALSLPQLTPELAAELASAGTAIFVDAWFCSASSPLDLWVEPLPECSREGSALVHALTPSDLLELCRAAYGHRPWAWQVSVPGADFSFGEGLSELAVRSMEHALSHDGNFARPRG